MVVVCNFDDFVDRLVYFDGKKLQKLLSKFLI